MRMTTKGYVALLAIATLVVSAWWLAIGAWGRTVEIKIVVPESFKGIAKARPDDAARRNVWAVQKSGEFPLSDVSVLMQWHVYTAQSTQGRPLQMFPNKDGVIGVFVSEEGKNTRVFVGNKVEAQQLGFPLDQYGTGTKLTR